MSPAVVEPRHHTARTDRPTRGAAVGVLARAKGSPFMPWQQDAADVACEFDPVTMHYAYGIIVVSVPRQAGKTFWESNIADHRCITTPRARVWITMQNGKTVDSWMREEHFEQLGRSRAFDGKYTQVRRAGEVGVKWGHGSSFYTFPPKRDALHSKQGDDVMVDEAWAHNAEVGADLRQAIRPTMATRRGSRLFVVSTMGDDASVYFDNYVELGRASLGDPYARVAFIDYGIGDDDDPNDLDVIAAHHPAYGYTLDRQSLVDAHTEFMSDPTLGAAGWARAYGNRPTRSRVAAIPPERWAAAGRPTQDRPARAGVGLDASPDGMRATLAAGWRGILEDPKLGPVDAQFVELLRTGPPTRELPQIIAQVCNRMRVPLTVDRGSMGALEIVDAVAQLRDAPEVRWLNLAEFTAGCGMFERGVLDDTLHHFNDPDLDAAVQVATKRNLGDGGFGWSRARSADNITELVAATVALKGFDLLPAALPRAVARAGRSSSEALRRGPRRRADAPA
jgi:hypothetical protein